MSELPRKILAWTAEPLSAEIRQSIERLARIDDVVRIALMPDVHLAESVCIGAVVATRELLLPDAVGGDVGCGMAAVQLDREAKKLDPRSLARILEGFGNVVPTLRQRERRPLPDLLANATLSHPSLQRHLVQEGSIQLGSLGSGNHFLELLAEEAGRLWLMVHTGSRSLGPAIRQHHVKLGQRVGNGLRALVADSEEGRAYLNDHELAVAYAELNRRRIMEAALTVLDDVLGTDADAATLVSSTHNFVRQEPWEDQLVWIHRKGSISAREGEPGIIPGSMGTESYLVEGRGSKEALFSSSHGAGRAMSRSRARQRIDVARLRSEMQGVCFDPRLARHLLDEAPSAYKSIASVMRAQKDLTRVVLRLRPVLSYKGVS